MKKSWNIVCEWSQNVENEGNSCGASIPVGGLTDLPL